MIKFLKKLDNPFLLAAEGFVAGAILFWAIAPDQGANENAAADSPPSAAAQVVPAIERLSSSSHQMGSD
ncbi:hypothetical protein [Sphingosinicella rhizophila]|uniref:Uncharacterized protein n=1 Tax=Sphingosinicella rhizophila TaxID=3050082 RepID=A0ABU3Q7P8_9SPHN|nr:hypothetical protein [Sphingosinicella sp. GR2756]MDT9599433.1 hypothetical protein [Sphingosinicella sp. GR2756]